MLVPYLACTFHSAGDMLSTGLLSTPLQGSRMTHGLGRLLPRNLLDEEYWDDCNGSAFPGCLSATSPTWDAAGATARSRSSASAI